MKIFVMMYMVQKYQTQKKSIKFYYIKKINFKDDDELVKVIDVENYKLYNINNET